MTTDGGGYTMVRFDDAALAGDQNAYAAKCAQYGMEIIVPRTKAHSAAITAWNGGAMANLYNIFPDFNGAGHPCGYSGCAHSVCATGGPLTSGCNSCVTTVCAADAYCCTTSWDTICVDEAKSMCPVEGIKQWHGVCGGAKCSFWMTDAANGNVNCAGFEPSGDNNVDYRIARTGSGCAPTGQWNDAYNAVHITGHVICSTNDK
jgi:hypothetical protein